MEAKVERRGGARPGAGRKPKKNKKRFKAVFLSEEAYNLLAGIRNKSDFVSLLIINAFRKQ